jgi:hypothetical protein
VSNEKNSVNPPAADKLRTPQAAYKVDKSALISVKKINSLCLSVYRKNIRVEALVFYDYVELVIKARVLILRNTSFTNPSQKPPFFGFLRLSSLMPIK